MGTFFFLILGALGLAAAVLAIIYLVVPVLTILGKLIGRVFTFLGGEIGDAVRIIGAVLTAVVFVPMALGNVVIGRWSASAHFTRALRDELAAGASCVYRICIGRPAWFLGLSALTDGIEHRVPEVVARAPGADRPSKRGSFDGYTVVGSLPPGGSGAKLYIAEPSEAKRAAFDALGRHGVGQVIIKSFSLHDGSSLPQIVRESRALEAAKNIGLVLEHELTDQRFYYAMPYIPGDALSVEIRRLHETSAGGGLDADKLRTGVRYAEDLVRTLARYHHAGLWHKDIKPDNIIVHDGRAHLVDLGLVTPLRSAMTLTTHGTEYFRDPELVRMALRGVKVHQVSGEKFDVYAAGAVLYAIIENSFPAHGGLSQIRKRCPESLRWVVRRAMAEYDKRYRSADEMLADLQMILAADDPAGVRPAELPSMTGAAQPFAPVTPVDEMASFTPPPETPAREEAPDPAPAGEAALPRTPARGKPAMTLVNWWTGSYRHDPTPVERARQEIAEETPARRTPVPIARPLPLERRDPAHEQLARARERVRTRRAAASRRMHTRRGQYRQGRPVSGRGRVFGSLAAVLGVMITGGLIVKGLTNDSHENSGSSVELTHLDDGGVSFFADSDSGLFRMTEADGTSYEITLNPEIVREAAKNWPEKAGQWRDIVLNRVVPAVVAAQSTPATTRVAAPQAPVARGSAGLTGTKWLLVDHLGSSVSGEDRDRVERKLRGLESTGLEWVTTASDAGLELVSGATAAIGIGTASDPKTIARLRAFLDHTPGVDGLVWVLDDAGPRSVALSGDRALEDRLRSVLRRSR